MGTVSMLHGERGFMIKTTDGKEIMIDTASTTTYNETLMVMPRSRPSSSSAPASW